VGHFGHNLSHVGRLGYVFAVAQDVHGVFAGSRWEIANISRTVAVVVAVDFGLRWTFNAETCTSKINLKNKRKIYGKKKFEIYNEPRAPSLPLVSTVKRAG